MISQFIKVLYQQKSSSSLAFIRIAMGLSLIYVLHDSFHIYFIEELLHSKYFVTYDFFHWVKPLPIFWFNIFFYTLYLSAFSLAIGFKYRFNAIYSFIGFTYCFLIDKGHYNNHYYLYAILLFFFTIVDAHRSYSVDSFLKKEKDFLVPNWQILIFKLQFFIVYFYGGLAKLHLDWLKGYPMRFWLYDNSFDFPNFIGDFLRSNTAAIIFSYTGLIFDLFIGFLLLNKRYRRIALIPIIIFHIFNHFLWNIGSFPWVMLLFTTIFFSDTWFKDFVSYLKKNKWKSFLFYKKITFKNIYTFFKIKKKENFSSNETLSYPYKNNAKKKLVTSFFLLWLVLQCIIPLRRFAIEGHASWTGIGHLFSWRMMLVDTLDAVKIKFRIPETNEEFNVGFEHYVSFRQFRKLTRTPMGIIRFSKFLSEEFKNNNPNTAFELKVIVWKSVNERTPQLLTDTTINYAEYPYEPWKAQSCFTDWKETDESPSFSIEKYANWKNVIEKDANHE